jgi:hypothetical protein
MVYLHCIALKMLSFPSQEMEAKLNQLLNKDIEITCSFEEIEEWLQDSTIEEDKKKYIIELTEKLKANKQENDK